MPDRLRARIGWLGPGSDSSSNLKKFRALVPKMERELEIPVVASNPAMIWFMLSKLESSHPMRGYGKLLSSWPALAVEG